MGDGVNIASWLEGMNKTFGTTICIRDSVFDVVAPEIVARPLRRVHVKGRKQEFMVYELLGMAKSEDPEIAIRPQDKRLSELTWLASKPFENGILAMLPVAIEKSWRSSRTILPRKRCWLNVRRALSRLQQNEPLASLAPELTQVRPRTGVRFRHSQVS